LVRIGSSSEEHNATSDLVSAALGTLGWPELVLVNSASVK
jgi:hypothetical protein